MAGRSDDFLLCSVLRMFTTPHSTWIVEIVILCHPTSFWDLHMITSRYINILGSKFLELMYGSRKNRQAQNWVLGIGHVDKAKIVIAGSEHLLQMTDLVSVPRMQWSLPTKSALRKDSQWTSKRIIVAHVSLMHVGSKGYPIWYNPT